MSRAVVVVIVLAGCKINFDPSTYDTCNHATDLGVPSFRWDGNDHCYTLHESALSGLTARDACPTIGAHRVTYQTPDELEAVRAGLAPAVPTWIGAIGTGGGFQWDTYEAMLYSNWAAGEPAAGVEAVMELDGTWRTATGAQAYICERSVVVTTDRVYTVEFDAAPWDTARALCELWGAHLATITSATELVTLQPLGGDGRWIGGHAATAGDYSWITGEPMSIVDWGPNRPFDPGNNQCIEATDTGWRDNNCAVTRPYICEYQ